MGRGEMADPGGGLQGLQPLLEIGKKLRKKKQKGTEKKEKEVKNVN